MKYPNAPIKEAIFDIRFDVMGYKRDDLKQFKNHLVDYSDMQNINKIQGTIQIRPGKPVQDNSTSKFNGLVFKTPDQSRQFQIRKDGFTFNVLNPYNSWEEHFEEFYSNWSKFYSIYNPKRVTRIAARFINRILIPLPLDFDEYITIMTPIPKGMPDTFISFFNQMSIPVYDKMNPPMIANITSTFEVPGEVSLPFILDIDVYEGNIKNYTDEYFRDSFVKIREAKNRIFENCITDKTRNLFL